MHILRNLSILLILTWTNYKPWSDSINATNIDANMHVPPCISASYNSVFCWFFQRSCEAKLVKTPACVKPRFCSRKRSSLPSRSSLQNISSEAFFQNVKSAGFRWLRKSLWLSFLNFVITGWTVRQSESDREPASVLDRPAWETSWHLLKSPHVLVAMRITIRSSKGWFMYVILILFYIIWLFFYF